MDFAPIIPVCFTSILSCSFCILNPAVYKNSVVVIPRMIVAVIKERMRYFVFIIVYFNTDFLVLLEKRFSTEMRYNPYMLGKKIAIDLGTSNSVIYVVGKGVVLKEPTVVAMSSEDKILAIGTTAYDMLGKTPEDILAVRPLKNGVVADYVTTEAMFKYFISRVMGSSRFFKPEVVVSVPIVATSVEARAVLDAVYSAGVKTAFLVPQPLGAAIGAGLPISEPSGNMIVNIGGGTADIAVVSLYGMVVSGGIRIGGMDLDLSIVQHLRRKYGLVIGDTTAERVKIDMGSAQPVAQGKMFEVKGRDAVSGFPRIISVDSNEIVQCLSYPLGQIAAAVKNVMEKTPPELASDIVDKGIVLSGGTALLHNLDKYIAEYTGVPVHVAEEPAFCVIRGLSKILDQLDIFSKSVIRK